MNSSTITGRASLGSHISRIMSVPCSAGGGPRSTSSMAVRRGGGPGGGVCLEGQEKVFETGVWIWQRGGGGMRDGGIKGTRDRGIEGSRGGGFELRGCSRAHGHG